MNQHICLLEQELTQDFKTQNNLKRMISSKIVRLALADAQLKHLLRYQMTLKQFGMPSKMIVETTFRTFSLFASCRVHYMLMLSNLLEAYEQG